MAQRAISLVKDVMFRGKLTTFSNTYHFYNAVGTGLGYEEMIDTLVAAEKKFHSTAVTYRTARLWSSGGTIQENETLFIKDLTGTGTGSLYPGFDRERAILIQWDCGRNILGRKVYLRKWFHSCGDPLGIQVGTQGVLENTSQISQVSRDALVTLAQGLQAFAAGGVEWELCSPRGVVYKSQPVAYPYLEHHQLGDNWRN